MLDFIKRRNNKDFASVGLDEEIKGIKIPVIELGKYPEIIKRVLGLIKKAAKQIADETGEDIDSVLDNINILSVAKYISILIDTAAEEFFEFAAYVLDTEVERIKKLGLSDMTRIVTKVYQVNEFAEVKEEISNFIKTLHKKQS